MSGHETQRHLQPCGVSTQQGISLRMMMIGWRPWTVEAMIYWLRDKSKYNLITDQQQDTQHTLHFTRLIIIPPAGAGGGVVRGARDGAAHARNIISDTRPVVYPLTPGTHAAGILWNILHMIFR